MPPAFTRGSRAPDEQMLQSSSIAPSHSGDAAQARPGLSCFASSRQRRLDPSGFDPYRTGAGAPTRTASLPRRYDASTTSILRVASRRSGPRRFATPNRAEPYPPGRHDPSFLGAVPTRGIGLRPMAGEPPSGFPALARGSAPYAERLRRPAAVAFTPLLAHRAFGAPLPHTHLWPPSMLEAALRASGAPLRPSCLRQLALRVCARSPNCRS